MRKTKIVATLGPASEADAMIDALLDTGVDVIRQNFSHGTHTEHGDVCDRVHDRSEQVPVMMDTQGPEVRLGAVADGTVLETDATVRLTTSDVTGDADRLPLGYDLVADLETGDTVFIDDGNIELEVTDVTEDDAICTVVFGGPVSSRKAVNVPGKDVGPDGLTAKDEEDIAFGAEHGFDMVAVSFVKRAADIQAVRGIVEEHDADMQIIAKIEHGTAVENIDAIIDAADGVMIARGDLGVEMPAAEVPLLQKEIIEECNRAGKPVITATQMLQSMTEKPHATRAEVSDVSNAVMDGTDAVMLSEETAVGDYPVQSVQVMADVVVAAEEQVAGRIHHTVKAATAEVADAITKSVWQAAHDVAPAYIVAHTSSGYTARNIAKYRPDAPVIAFTDSRTVQRQLNPVWGVRAYHMDFPANVDTMICESTMELYETDMVDEDDVLVLSAGVPTSVTETTNMMEVRRVADILDEHGSR